MRADRLVATLLLMQDRGRVTAAELADELEVSVATARRDLEALSAAGIPVYPQAGRGGGWQLLGRARTDLSGLTEPEARALFLLLGPGAAAAPEARSALRKLLTALPATFRAGARTAAESLVVDSRAWGEQTRQRPPLVDLLQTAVINRRFVEIRYAGRHREPARRIVAPWALIDKDGQWYVIAGTDNGRRTFRVDRISEAVVTSDDAERPDDFDLQQAWDEVVDTVEQRRSRVSAEVWVDHRLAPVVAGQFGRHATELETTDGRTRLRVASHTARSIAEHLAGFGGAVQLIGPDSVRAELATIGGELVRANSADPMQPNGSA